MNGGQNIKFRLTETALELIKSAGIDPRTYGSNSGSEFSFGLELRNMGKEAVVYGRNKHVAFGEKSDKICTGIKLAIPNGYIAMIKEDLSILSTSLIVRDSIYGPGYTDEITVSLINIGERDTVIPTGAQLPVQLIVVPCAGNFNIVSDLEYLDEISFATSPVQHSQ